MHATDLIGCIASGLVLLTFYMNDMIALRTIALCSNVAFIVYAASLHLTPILLLHSILIPINLWRLIAALRANDFLRTAEILSKAPSRLVNLAARVVWVLSYPVRMLQTGRVSRYALFMLLGVLIFLGYYLHSSGITLQNLLH